VVLQSSLGGQTSEVKLEAFNVRRICSARDVGSLLTTTAADNQKASGSDQPLYTSTERQPTHDLEVQAEL
jgi:hypothetical protein